ncbi:hypothetical protein [Streptomyces sp. TP-A0874]|uniref:hypothetical protein n=1 Tax=Streptomyces sp. TP-A0874 TaxID=549819 RepID=UPI000852ABAA|nr:hypothetical protein [Streptomyces sp. TP-A0874]
MSFTSDRPQRRQARSAAAAANDAIRAFVAGRRSWSSEDLAELDRLRAAWRRALEQGVDKAA